MKEFLQAIESKYALTDFTGHIGTLLSEDSEKEDIEKGLEFLQDLYDMASNNLSK